MWHWTSLASRLIYSLFRAVNGITTATMRTCHRLISILYTLLVDCQTVRLSKQLSWQFEKCLTLRTTLVLKHELRVVMDKVFSVKRMWTTC